MQGLIPALAPIYSFMLLGLFVCYLTHQLCSNHSCLYWDLTGLAHSIRSLAPITCMLEKDTPSSWSDWLSAHPVLLLTRVERAPGHLTAQCASEHFRNLVLPGCQIGVVGTLNASSRCMFARCALGHWAITRFHVNHRFQVFGFRVVMLGFGAQVLLGICFWLCTQVSLLPPARRTKCGTKNQALVRCKQNKYPPYCLSSP